MAEFQEVMKEAIRMCDSYLKPGSDTSHFCDRCPLNTGSYRDNCFVTYGPKPPNYEEAEKAVIEWAEEHPRMTWLDLMRKYGVVYLGRDDLSKIDKNDRSKLLYVNYPDGTFGLNYTKANEPIPDEIAKIAMREE